MPLYNVVNGFLSASLISIVSYILCMGLPVYNMKNSNFISDVQNDLGNCTKAKQIYDCATSKMIDYDLITYFTEWSDTFDPNTSSKNNHASVFVKSITFPKCNDSTYPTSFYTFPICIGPGKKSKFEFEQNFLEEIQAFQKDQPLIFWDNHSRTKKKVYVDILCSMQDQPERRSGLNLMMGNSNFFPRFGYSCNYLYINKVQKSCLLCEDYLWNNKQNIEECSKCVNWDIDSDNKLCYFKPNDKYPKDCDMLLPNGMLRPKKITTEFLISIVNKTINKIQQNSWTKGKAYEYLCTYGVNPEYVKLIIDEAKNNNNVTIPPTWKRNLNISDHVETLMHLIFLGITKTVLKDIHIWLKNNNLFTKFLKIADTTLLPILKLKLQWCKVIPYGTGKFGGHVSENYLAMSRIIKWFVCVLNPLGNSVNDEALVRNIIDTTTAMYAMITRIMQREINTKTIDSTERHVKIFLNSYVELDRKLNGDDNVSWINKYNFLSLLNLKQQMINFGPLLNLWEGGISGEKIISTMKPEIKSGLRQNWHKHLFLKWMRKYFFNFVRHNKDLDGNNVVLKPVCNAKYGSITEVAYFINHKMPFIAHHNDTGILYIRTKLDNYYKLLPDGASFSLSNCTFHSLKWEIWEPVNVTFSDPECLLLPCMNNFIYDNNINNVTGKYYIITEMWLEFNEKFVPTLPTAHKLIKYDDEHI
jgi:hypothetical protein